MTKPLHYTRTWQRLGYLGIVVIVILSVTPVDQPLQFDHADKWLHWVTWMVMMAWFGSAWPQARTRFFFFLLATGAALELLQGLLPWRFMDIIDLVANIAGLLSGVLLLFTPAGLLLARFDQFLVNRFDAPPV